MDQYKREMRRRPVMITTAPVVTPANRSRSSRALARRRNRVPPAYRTRAVRSEQIEEEEQDDVNNQSYKLFSDTI